MLLLMIKFEYSYFSVLINEIYKSDFLKNTEKKSKLFIEKLELIDKDLSCRYTKLVEIKNIKALIALKPNEVEPKIQETFEEFPELAFFFNPRWILKSKNFDFNRKNLGYPNNIDMKYAIKLRDIFTKSLNDIKNSQDFPLIQYFTQKLSTFNNAKELCQTLYKISNLHLGIGVIPKKIKRTYPQWPLEILEIFKYESFRNKFSYKVVKLSGLLVCPYCNKRDIEQTIGRYKKANPDLDHYYSRSKYPFLSLTINNLIPSCNFCNQKFKRDTDTYLYFMNPTVRGTEDYTVFRFIPNLDDTPSLFMDGCEYFRRNINLFELESEYKKQISQDELKKVFELSEFLSSLGDDAGKFNVEEKLKKLIGIGKNRTPKDSAYYKLKIDAVNSLIKRDYR